MGQVALPSGRSKASKMGIAEVAAGEDVDAALVVVGLALAGGPLALQERAEQLVGQRRHDAGAAALGGEEAGGGEHGVADGFAGEALAGEVGVEGVVGVGGFRSWVRELTEWFGDLRSESAI